MGGKDGGLAAGAAPNGRAAIWQGDKYNIGMASLEFSRQQFLGSQSAVTRFARNHIDKNEFAGLQLDRKDVMLMWWLNAGKIFPRGDPKREEIMDQVYSPLFHEFWATRTHNPEYKGESRVFQRVECVVSREENERYPHSVIMESETLSLLVPGILSSAIQYIAFKDTVRWVLEANQDLKIDLSDMVSLWDAIIHIIYHFEPSTTQEKKIHESEDANSFTLEEYRQLVEEIREGATMGESRARGAKRVHSEGQISDQVEGVDVDPEVSLSDGRKKKSAPCRSVPDEDSVLPSIDFTPSAATPSTFPPNLTSEAAPSTKNPRADSQPIIKAKQKAARSESENPQDKGQLGQQGTRMPGNDPPRANKEEAADRTQGGRMMQVNRRGSASRKRRGTYVHSIPEL